MRFWIRAEASKAIGYGHALRCIGLAEQLIALGHSVQMTWEDWPDEVRAKVPRGLKAALGPDAIEVIDSYTLKPVTARSIAIGYRPWWFLRNELRNIPRGRSSLKTCVFSFGGPQASQQPLTGLAGVACIAPQFADYASALARADVVVGGFGVSSLERCYFGIPSLALIIADNQMPNARAQTDAFAAILIAAENEKIAAHVSHWLRVLQNNPDLLEFISLKAMRLVQRDSFSDFWREVDKLG